MPVQYGGLSRPNDLHNGPAKPASGFTVKGGEKVNIQIEGIEVHIFCPLFDKFLRHFLHHFPCFLDQVLPEFHQTLSIFPIMNRTEG